MPRVDVFATEPHYLDHIAPVWKALPTECRGRIIVPQHLAQYANALGMAGHDGHNERTHIIVAGWSDTRNVYMWDNIVLMEHGVGQSYLSEEDGTWAPSAYAGGPGRTPGDIALYLCPNQRVADLNAGYGPCAIIGDPYLDQLERDMVRPNIPQVFDVTFSWHWNCEFQPETMSAWTHYRAELIQLRHKDGGPSIAGTSHPRAWKDLRRWYKQTEIFSVQSLSLAIQAARVFACDNSSAMYYAAALGRPVIVLNAPWYRDDVEHGLRFWEYADVGINVQQPAELESVIQESLEAPSLLRERAEEISAVLFPYRDGRSGLRGAEAICGTF